MKLRHHGPRPTSQRHPVKTRPPLLLPPRDSCRGGGGGRREKAGLWNDGGEEGLKEGVMKGDRVQERMERARGKRD